MCDSIVLDVQHWPVVCERLLGTLQYLQFEPFDIHFHEVYVPSANHVVKTYAGHLNTSSHRFCLDRHSTKIAIAAVILMLKPNRTGLRCTSERPRCYIVQGVQREIRAEVLEHEWLWFERDDVGTYCLGGFCQCHGLASDISADLNDCARAIDPLLQELRFQLTVLTVFNQRLTDIYVTSVCKHRSMSRIDENIRICGLYHFGAHTDVVYWMLGSIDCTRAVQWVRHMDRVDRWDNVEFLCLC
ncbi:hypothetical protein AQ477_18395 (plasmid) [Burkholderia thailandensis]|nr:hypothetical protein AQ477_18395 [Burkholderia thailandensis]KXF59714.1 hypothetical protein AQ476_17925 [Burkholderia thailandensis]